MRQAGWPSWAKWAAGAVAVLVGAGLVWDLLRPEKPAVTIEQKAEWERTLATERARAEKAEETLRATQLTISELSARMAESERRAANVTTTAREVVYRYAPGTAAPAPTTVNITSPPTGPGAPAPAAAQPVEIVIRDTRSEDRSTVDRTKETEAAGKTTTETMVDASRTGETTETEKTKATDTGKVETKVTETPRKDPEAGRLGIGVTDRADPFASFDLAKVRLGPRPLRLGTLGAGVFATIPRTGEFRDVDGGPQVNYQKSRFFGMVGYGVRRQEVRFGVGVKF